MFIPDPDPLARTERTILRGFAIEAVRVELETRILRQLVQRFGDELWASMPSSETVRRGWLAGAVGFSPELAPRAFRVAGEARRVLGVAQEVELYQAADHESRACIARTEGGPLHIRVHDVFLAHPDDAVLLFVIGHEMGHGLAHAPDRLRGPDPFLVYQWFARGRRAGVREVAAAFRRAAELTADRVALLACQDLDVALRTFMVLSSGQPGPALVGREPAYLATCREHVERLLRRRERGSGDTHPEDEVRAYALWAFAETEAYRALTGRGTGAMSLTDLDRTLDRLVGPSLSADDEGIPEIPPSLVERAGEKLEATRQGVGDVVRSSLGKLRRSSAGWMDGVARRAFGLAVPGRPQPEPEPGERGPEDLPPDSEESDLEKRFAVLERTFARPAAAHGTPDETVLDPPAGNAGAGNDDAEDLERRFTELERRMAQNSH